MKDETPEWREFSKVQMELVREQKDQIQKLKREKNAAVEKARQLSFTEQQRDYFKQQWFEAVKAFREATKMYSIDLTHFHKRYPALLITTKISDLLEDRVYACGKSAIHHECCEACCPDCQRVKLLL